MTGFSRSLDESLLLIDEWIEALCEDDLPEQCQRSTDGFMTFMEARGVPRDELEALISDATGLLPQNLGTLQGVQELKAAIFNNEASQADALNSGPSASTPMGAMGKAREWWGSLF